MIPRRSKKRRLFIHIFFPSILVMLFITIGILYLFSETHNIFYDFEDQKVGSFPDGFVGLDRRVEDIHIVEWNKTDELYGKVLRVSYLEENDYGGVECNLLFKQSKKGIVEFDLFPDDNKMGIILCQKDTEYNYRDDINIKVPKNSEIAVMDKNGEYKEIMKFTKEIWYHFKIEYNIDTGFNVSITNEYRFTYVYLFDFFYDPPYFCQIYFSTYQLGTIFYLDNLRIRTY